MRHCEKSRSLVCQSVMAVDMVVMHFLDVCENIHSWISLIGDLAFSHQGEIYGFKFPKKFFWRSLSEISLF